MGTRCGRACRIDSWICERFERSSSISFSHASSAFFSSFICLICFRCTFSCWIVSDACCISCSLARMAFSRSAVDCCLPCANRGAGRAEGKASACASRRALEHATMQATGAWDHLRRGRRQIYA